MLISQKQKLFSEFLKGYLKCTLNFDHFQKKEDPHSRCVFEITETEKGD